MAIQIRQIDKRKKEYLWALTKIPSADAVQRLWRIWIAITGAHFLSGSKHKIECSYASQKE
jgi:hypothetical protein